MNGDKNAKCEIIEAIVQTAVNLAIDVTLAVVTDGIGMAVQSAVNNLVERTFRKLLNTYQASRMTRTLTNLRWKDSHLLGLIKWSGSKKDVQNSIGSIIRNLKISEIKRLNSLKPGVEAGLNSAWKQQLKQQNKNTIKDLKRVAKLWPEGGLHDLKVHLRGDLREKFGEEVDHLTNEELHQAIHDIHSFKNIHGIEDVNAIKDFHAIHDINAIEEIHKNNNFPDSDQMLRLFSSTHMPRHPTRAKDNKGEPQEWDDKVAPYITNVLTQLAWNPTQHVPQNWMVNYYHMGNSQGWLTDGAEKESIWDSSLVGKAYRSWPVKKLEEIQSREQAPAPLKGGFTDLPAINGGQGVGWMCSDFEGDWKDHNAQNIEILKKRISAELDNGRRQVSTLFKEMYEGATPEPGQPSMVARWMTARKWVGKNEPGTVEYDLNHKDANYRHVIYNLGEWGILLTVLLGHLSLISSRSFLRLFFHKVIIT